MSSARTEILERVGGATKGTAGTEPVPRAYRRVGALAEAERIEFFCRRVGEYRADVQRIAWPEVAAKVSAVCRAHGVRRLVVPAGTPANWLPSGVDIVDDDALSPRGLDAVDGTLTACTAAIAETGTIILTAGPGEGRRALTLVPDLHICVVRESQIVELPPEAIALISDAGLERRPITFISGPSATSDIELSRVEGVHGPRNLVVLVATEPT